MNRSTLKIPLAIFVQLAFIFSCNNALAVNVAELEKRLDISIVLDGGPSNSVYMIGIVRTPFKRKVTREMEVMGGSGQVSENITLAYLLSRR